MSQSFPHLDHKAQSRHELLQNGKASRLQTHCFMVIVSIM